MPSNKDELKRVSIGGSLERYGSTQIGHGVEEGEVQGR